MLIKSHFLSIIRPSMDWSNILKEIWQCNNDKTQSSIFSFIFQFVYSLKKLDWNFSNANNLTTNSNFGTWAHTKGASVLLSAFHYSNYVCPTLGGFTVWLNNQNSKSIVWEGCTIPTVEKLIQWNEIKKHNEPQSVMR